MCHCVTDYKVGGTYHYHPMAWINSFDRTSIISVKLKGKARVSTLSFPSNHRRLYHKSVIASANQSIGSWMRMLVSGDIVRGYANKLVKPNVEQIGVDEAQGADVHVSMNNYDGCRLPPRMMLKPRC